MKLAVSIIISIILHIVIGWEWSAVGGIVAGFWVLKRGWVAGMITVGVAWSILLVYNLVVATEPIIELFRVAGELAGGLPPVVQPLATILTGCVIGACAGALGRAVGHLREEPVVVEIE